MVEAGSAGARGGVVARVHRRYPALLPLVVSVGVLVAFFGGRMYSDWRDVKDNERLEAMRVRLLEVRDGLGGVLAPFGGPGLDWETAWDSEPWLDYGSNLMIEPENDPSRKWLFNMGIGGGAMGEGYTAEQAADAVVDHLLASGWEEGAGNHYAGYTAYIKHDELGGWAVRIRYTTKPPPAEQNIDLALRSPFLDGK